MSFVKGSSLLLVNVAISLIGPEENDHRQLHFVVRMKQKRVISCPYTGVFTSGNQGGPPWFGKLAAFQANQRRTCMMLRGKQANDELVWIKICSLGMRCCVDTKRCWLRRPAAHHAPRVSWWRGKATLERTPPSSSRAIKRENDFIAILWWGNGGETGARFTTTDLSNSLHVTGLQPPGLPPDCKESVQTSLPKGKLALSHLQ